jgi:hypothetical protein
MAERNLFYRNGLQVTWQARIFSQTVTRANIRIDANL